MRYADMHCDTLMNYAFKKDYDIFSSDRQVDLKKLKEGECCAQFFAMFLPDPSSYERSEVGVKNDEDYIGALSKGLFDAIGAHPDMIAFAGNLEDYKKNDFNDLVSAFLTIEDGRSVNGDLGNLDRYHELGVRLISLTWNHENCFGYPNSDDPSVMNAGLKDFGKEAVEYMNDLGIIVDVSHLSDGGFYDVADVSKKPFVASHSDCRSITNHRRNMTDDMIRILASKGGAIGINFCPDFMIPDKGKKNGMENVLIDHMIMHLRHMVDVGGIECAAIGTDFDGIHGDIEIPYASGMQELFERMKMKGFTESEIEKIARKNVLRVIGDSMK